MSDTKKNKTKESELTFEEGTGNVFADLDFPDAEECLAKAELILKINQIIKKKKLKQKEAAKILETDQSKISLLNRGHLSAFSIERLVRYLNLLNQDVFIVIKQHRKSKTEIGQLRVAIG